MKVQPKVDDGGVIVGYVFHCPGCEHGHIFYVSGSVVWDFDGNLECPTFSPSLLNTCDTHPDPKQRRCHLQLTRGHVHFYKDCSHDWAGKSFELPDIVERMP